jgi:hypothetical protein
MKKVSDKSIIEALKINHGLVSIAADALGVDINTIYARMKEVPEVKQVCIEAREITIDKAESKLMELVEEKSYNAIQFLLRSLAKNRGYGESQEINLNSNNKNMNIDFSKLSLEEKLALEQLLSKAGQTES